MLDVSAAATAPFGDPPLRDPPPSFAARTSDFVMRPFGPVPERPPTSTPSAAATRAATGEMLVPSGGVAAPADEAFSPLSAGAGVDPPDDAAPAPVSMRAMTCPTVTVSPSAARISVIVPAPGAGSSTSTLSVEISTIVSPSAM